MRPLANDSNNTKISGIWIIAIVAICVALFFAREILAPIAFAFLFSVVLRPPVRWLEKIHIPTWVGASLITLAALGLLILLVFLISAPLQKWMEQAPQSISTAEKKLAGYRQRFQK